MTQMVFSSINTKQDGLGAHPLCILDEVWEQDGYNLNYEKKNIGCR